MANRNYYRFLGANDNNLIIAISLDKKIVNQLFKDYQKNLSFRSKKLVPTTKAFFFKLKREGFNVELIQPIEFFHF